LRRALPDIQPGKAELLMSVMRELPERDQAEITQRLHETAAGRSAGSGAAADIDDEVRAVLAEAAAGGRVRADLLAVPIEVATAFAEMLRGWAIAAGPGPPVAPTEQGYTGRPCCGA